MLTFIFGLLLLIIGYLTYGRLVELILRPDNRTTPAVASADGVDFLVLPKWKNMLIQLLNIAGVGPVLGVILGIKFGSIVFIIIPVGCILGGAVYDMVFGMMSLRNNGANLPTLVAKYTTKWFSRMFSIFTAFLLLLAVAVFVTAPAQLVDGQSSRLFSTAAGGGVFRTACVLIFLYYIAAAMFSVDAIIGRLYPLFGALLLIGTVCLMVMLVIEGVTHPEILKESVAFTAKKFCNLPNPQPVIPCLFVTIACGILSGAHATQSPIVARTMKSEREARATFYGMMIGEGFIAMIWAVAALAVYNHYPQLMDKSPAFVLNEIAKYFLGNGFGSIAVLSVIILSITSGDTALRSMRLILAEIFNYDQTSIRHRLQLTLPLVAAVSGLLWWAGSSSKTFGHCWNYFAWGNQTLAAVTLTICTVWLFRERKCALITLIPAVFMTFIVVTYICWTSPAHGGPYGLGMELIPAMMCGFLAAFGACVWSIFAGVYK